MSGNDRLSELDELAGLPDAAIRLVARTAKVAALACDEPFSALGRYLPPNAYPLWAIDLLGEGRDGQYLRMLAASAGEADSEVYDLTRRALAEMGVPRLSLEEMLSFWALGITMEYMLGERVDYDSLHDLDLIREKLGHTIGLCSFKAVFYRYYHFDEIGIDLADAENEGYSAAESWLQSRGRVWLRRVVDWTTGLNENDQGPR